MMRRILITSVLIALGAPGAAWSDAAKPACELNKAALKRLEDMGAFLRQQRAFTVESQTETDEVLDTGQKVQLSAKTELEVRRPDRLHASYVSDRREREFFYDGKSFTVYGPTTKYYATVPAPPTIDGLLGRLSERYDIELPLVDLFLWGTPSSGVELVQCASFIGTAKIGETKTDHLAFRQDGLDWQIWIEQGARPLPKKLVLTTTDDPDKPQHSITLDWNLSPTQDLQAFVFTPPRGASRIELADRSAPQAAQRPQRRTP